MLATLHIARDVIREALSRRWILGLAAVLTLVLGVVAISLRLDVVDGALAATSFWGRAHAQHDIRAVDVALRPFYSAVAFLTFYGGILFGVLACADFAPSLLAPGRIEHLLSLPVSRGSILFGTFLGVALVMGALAAYGGLGIVVILAIKTGTWMPQLLYASVLGTFTFMVLYATMLTAALWVRSAALTATVGLALFTAGTVASFREEVLAAISGDIGKAAFEMISYALPPITELAVAAAGLAGSEVVDLNDLTSRLIGFGLFGFGALVVGVWRFEGMDF